MEYNKALENYKKIINNIESQIKEREDKVAELKGNIQSIKEDRKKEVKNGIFTKTIKKFTKTSTISEIGADIEVLLYEIEALQELKNGDSDELMKAAKELVNSVYVEEKRMENERKAKEEKREELLKQAKDIQDDLYNTANDISILRTSTANVLSELIKTKYDSQYAAYINKGLETFHLAEKLLEE
ncbi:hypothetical protein [Clostridium beijerinckii]|uniref:hypothetical protein n=1 Tax=Clostridium beijerinckii TaxID=1520 RepID=UPI0002D2BB03|nr:hypothetical protein [Clostridium beijerinckii]